VTDRDEMLEGEFAKTQERWREVMRAHRMAPPDAGFSARLAELAAAAREQARVCREAAEQGYSWPPHSANEKPPYELQPGTGRRGPDTLWQRFDAAATELARASGGSDLVEVADAHALLAEAAGALAAAVEREDRASGLLPQAEGRSA
jgi:hypothetical protein